MDIGEANLTEIKFYKNGLRLIKYDSTINKIR